MADPEQGVCRKLTERMGRPTKVGPPHDSGIDSMLNAQTDFIGAVRRCVGDAVLPEAAEIERVAAKIWRDCTPSEAGFAAWPAACRDLDFYRRAARIALEGYPCANAR